MTKQIEIDYAFGYVFDKSKLVVMYPVGTNIMNKDEYEMEVEVAFLEDGIEKAFEEGDIQQANEIIKPLEMFLMKPNKVVPFITSMKDADTKDELNKLLQEFDKEYELKENYINKGYDIQDVYYVFENVIKYIPKENLETLNILKIECDRFEMDKFINCTQTNLDEAIDSNLTPVGMIKSELTDRLFIKTDKDKVDGRYIPFATDISTYSNGFLCANLEKIEETDLDMGDLEISKNMEVGYLVQEIEGYFTFKICNYNYQTQNNNQIAQIVDYSGILKPMMIDYINSFIK